MGLLDFDVGKIANNDAFMMGMNVLKNNQGHYGDTGAALGYGLQDYQRQKSLQAQQARANALAEQRQAQMMQQAELFKQQQEQYKQAQAQQLAQKQAMTKQYPNLVNLPKNVQTAKLAQMYPKSATYGTTPHFGPKGNAYQLSSTGGARKVGVPLQKPLQQINTGQQQFGVNQFTNQPVGPTFQNKLKPAEKPRYKSEVKAAEKEGAALGTAKTELADREATLPRLQQVVSELSELGKKATYTQAGQAFNSAKRQMGLNVGEGAIARKEYEAKVNNEILPLLRQTFGAAFTAAEGESLKATLGDPNVSPEEKDAVLRSFIDSKKESINTLKRRTGQGQNFPQVGEERDGYRFKGGNPALPGSWEIIQ